jgi:hypothetical protein
MLQPTSLIRFSGDTVRADDWRALIQYIHRISPRAGTGITLDASPSGTTISARPSTGGSAPGRTASLITHLKPLAVALADGSPGWSVTFGEANGGWPFLGETQMTSTGTPKDWALPLTDDAENQHIYVRAELTENFGELEKLEIILDPRTTTEIATYTPTPIGHYHLGSITRDTSGALKVIPANDRNVNFYVIGGWWTWWTA